MMSPVGHKNSDQRDGESFQRALFYHLLDSLTAELQRRFFIEELEDNAKGPVSRPKEYNILE
jgi:hypothetical protein